jgi:hypothetical protein
VAEESPKVAIFADWKTGYLDEGYRSLLGDGQLLVTRARSARTFL